MEFEGTTRNWATQGLEVIWGNVVNATHEARNPEMLWNMEEELRRAKDNFHGAYMVLPPESYEALLADQCRELCRQAWLEARRRIR